MDPPPEDQITTHKVAEIKKQNQDNNGQSNGQIDLKNTNSMQNNESLQEQNLCSESIGTMKPFEYSMNSSYSLHSHLSTAEKIQEIKGERDEAFQSQEVMSFNKNLQSSRKQVPLLEPNHVGTYEHEENITKANFMKSKVNLDSIDHKNSQNQTKNTPQKEISERNQKQQPRKSYTSYLHKIVGKSHLESPKREQQKNKSTQQPKQQSNQLPLSNNSSKQEGQNLQLNNIEKPLENPIIKPIPITEKKIDKKDSSPQSPVLPRTKKKERQQLEIRRIPSNLYESYDQLMLTVNADDKLMNKDNIISPIKLKEKPNHNLTKKKSKENDKFDDSPKGGAKKPQIIQTNFKNKNIDQQLLVSFPIIEGYCQLKTDSSQLYETKFIMNKNTICFQTFKQIFISAISKIKLIEKDEKQITVKITYEQDQNSKPENFIINLLTESSDSYFSQTYRFFSHIVLRKLILMKLYINELHEKYQVESPIKSPQSSPLSLPMTMPSILTRKTSQTTQSLNEVQTLLQSNLYKKSTFFNSWEKKYFALTSKNLQSYTSSSINGQKQKPSNQLSKTSQIWTRFELTYGYLVIKMWQSKIQKFQIGIPLCDFTNPQGKNNWLYGLSRNLLWKKPQTKQQKTKTTIVG